MTVFEWPLVGFVFFQLAFNAFQLLVNRNLHVANRNLRVAIDAHSETLEIMLKNERDYIEILTGKREPEDQ